MYIHICIHIYGMYTYVYIYTYMYTYTYIVIYVYFVCRPHTYLHTTRHLTFQNHLRKVTHIYVTYYIGLCSTKRAVHYRALSTKVSARATYNQT